MQKLAIVIAPLVLYAAVLGAFYDEETATLIGVSLDEEWPAHFFAFGAPRS